MKPFNERIEGYLAGKANLDTPVQALRLVIWMFEREFEALDKAIWDADRQLKDEPGKVGMRHIRLAEARERLQTDLQLVEGLCLKAQGLPLPKPPRPHLRLPNAPYGER